MIMEKLHPVVRFFSLFFVLILLGSFYVILCDIRSGFLSTRLPLSLLSTFLIVTRSYRKQRLSKSGALGASIVGFLHFHSSPAFTGALLAFFFSSSLATRIGQETKKRVQGKEFRSGGQRNWIQVMCNGLVSSTGALLHLLLMSEENVIHSVFGRSVLLANAVCTGDTWASELGMVLSSKDPFHVLTLRRVPRGTNGGVSPLGLVLSLLGGAFVGLNFAWPLLLFGTLDLASLCVSLCLGALGGLCGSFLDSLLGGLFQYSGVDEDGAIHQSEAPGVRRICGAEILDNDSVNILSCIITTLGMVGISTLVY